jgi:rubrerythrin
MQAEKDRLLRNMMQTSFELVRSAFIARVREEVARTAEGVRWLESQGYERFSGGEEIPGQFLPDGRMILAAHGARWVISEDRYAQDKASARTRSTILHTSVRESAAKPGEALTSVLCPVCQSTMAKSPVCPNCSKAKQGFKILCLCAECNHEVYL